MNATQSAERNREKALKLALTLGWLGGHRFYTGQTLSGLAYLAFFWTLIPVFLSLIDAAFLARMSDDDFADEYCPLPDCAVAATKTPLAAKKDSLGLTA
jgi:TM2 domain-containing membrane protein YozV